MAASRELREGVDPMDIAARLGNACALCGDDSPELAALTPLVERLVEIWRRRAPAAVVEAVVEGRAS